ncbi:MAG: hypothetical protein JWN84_3228 [Nocardioides sp.]|nr:hypothetical protein [Nocardioides sp.]
MEQPSAADNLTGRGVESRSGAADPDPSQEASVGKARNRRHRRWRRFRRRVRRALRRRAVLAGLAIVVVTVGWSAWSAYRVQVELREAEAALDELVTSVRDRDGAGREAAAIRVQQRALAAREGTDGPWWATMTLTPYIGDDLRGLRAMSESLDTLASEGVPPLLAAADRADQGLAEDSQVDLAVLAELADPVDAARSAFARAADNLEDVDPVTFVPSFRRRYEDYRAVVVTAEQALVAGASAIRELPSMLGRDGPRDYLLVFQNNAEIRATGGLAGAWARVHAERGRLSIEEQGSASDFDTRRDGAPYLSAQELALYGAPMGRYFQDAGVTPDFDRAAELLAGHFTETYGHELDGVVSIDPVALSYVLDGVGGVEVGRGLTLSSDNVIEVLLHEVYLRLRPDQQDRAFQLVTRRVFTALTDTVPEPVAVILGMFRAATEDRFRVAAFDRPELDTDVGADPVPHVDIALNDATGAKMSYFLRHDASVEAIACDGIGRQELAGRLRLTQDIDQTAAADLPDYVSGGNRYGVAVGSQAVVVRLFGPRGGSIQSISLAGAEQTFDAAYVGGRPSVAVAVVLSGRQALDLDFAMLTGPGQSADGLVDVTPGVEPGDLDSTFDSAC